MKKNLRYFMTLLLMMVASVGWGADETVSVTLSSGTFETDHITWSAANGGITIQQLKGTSTNAVNSSYIGAPRLYKGHILSFKAADNYKIKSISITYNGSYCGNSMTAGTEVSENTVTDNTTAVNRTWATANGGTHVVSAVSSDGLSQIYIQNVAESKGTQLRPSSISITYSYSGTAYVDTPTFTPEGEVYSESQIVTISTTTEGATIYYTTDGSDPTTSSTRQTYSSQITVTANTTIKAYAVKDGYNDSDVAVSTFTIFGGVDPKNINSNYFEKVTDVNKLVNGDAILIVNEEYAKALSTTQSGNYRGEADVTINANTIDAPSAEVQKLVLAGENGAWFLSVGGENSFLYSPETGYYLETKETVSDAARATITITNGNAEIRFNGSNTANLISYNYNNGTNSRFSCYVAPQSHVQIYKEVVKPNKEEVTVSFNEPTKTVNVDETVTNVATADVEGVTVVYSSSDTSIATVNEGGVVTGVAAGTATITATIEEAANYDVTVATYEIQVIDPSAPVAETYTFNKITSTDDLVAGGEYIIVCEDQNVVMAKYGVGNAKVFDKYAIQIDNNSIEIEKGKANNLTLGGETDAWTFATSLEEGHYLGLSSSSNELHSLTEGKITWSIAFDNGNCVITPAAYETRTIRYNSGSPRFACYTSGQKAIQLYKKVETITLKDYDKRTYVTTNALDFSSVSSTLTAYVATAQNGSDVTFDPVTKVPAGTPLLVKGATTNVPVIASATAPAVNLLVAGPVASLASTTTEEGTKYYNFILNAVNNEVGFYRAAEYPVAADRAYLRLDSDIPTGSGAKVNLIFSDEESTGINNVNAVESTNEKVFNLAGQQIKSAVKGVYIKNGKKYVK